jgi:restriction endonuclease S subunit
MTDYLVTLNEPGPYRIGVDYEIPTKSIQYGNIILDNINSQFTGVAHTFGLTATGTAYVPINDQQLIVVKNNLVMEPIEDYTTSTNNIIFTVAPNPGDDVFIIALATTADLTRTLNYVVDSGSIAMLSGNKGSVTLDVSGVLESLTILSDQQGDLTLDIKKSNYSTFPTFTSIVGGVYPQMTNVRKVRDDNLNNWDTSIVAGDILTFDVIAVNNINRFLISLKLKL